MSTNKKMSFNEMNKFRFFLQVASLIFFEIGLHILIYNVDSIILKVLLTIIIGYLLVGNYVVGHEIVHQRIFKSKSIDNLFGFIIMFPTMTNYYDYSHGHLVHHKYSTTHKDPSLIELSSLPRFFKYLLVIFHYMQFSYLLVIPLTIYEEFIKNQGIKKLSGISVPVFIILLAAVFFSSEIIIYSILLPYIFFCFFQTLKNSAEHDYLYIGENGSEYQNLTTRNIKSTFITRWFWFNCMYHKEHHLNMNLPYHDLSKYYCYKNNELTYLDFLIVRCKKGLPHPMFI